MMWGVRIFGRSNVNPLHSCKPWEVYKSPDGLEEVLITEDYVTAFGVHKSTDVSVASTTIIAAPLAGGSIALTDILISGRKKTSGLVGLQWNDGTDQTSVVKYSAANDPVDIQYAVKGRMQGWEDARLELVTVQDFIVFATIGYVKLPFGLGRADWLGFQ